MEMKLYREKGFYNLAKRCTRPNSVFKEWFTRVKTITKINNRTFLKNVAPGDYYISHTRHNSKTGRFMGSSFELRFILEEIIINNNKKISVKEYKNTSIVKKEYKWVFVGQYFIE